MGHNAASTPLNPGQGCPPLWTHQHPLIIPSLKHSPHLAAGLLIPCLSLGYQSPFLSIISFSLLTLLTFQVISSSLMTWETTRTLATPPPPSYDSSLCVSPELQTLDPLACYWALELNSSKTEPLGSPALFISLFFVVPISWLTLKSQRHPSSSFLTPPVVKVVGSIFKIYQHRIPVATGQSPVTSCLYPLHRTLYPYSTQ